MNQEGSNNKEIELQRQDESKIEGLDESDDDEEFDEKFIQDQLNATVWSDLKQSVYDVRYLIPIIALLGILLAYQMTIAPYRTNIVDNMIGQNSKDLKTIRPVLTDEVLKNIQYIMLRQENEIEMPFPDSGSFTMRFVQSVDKHGTHELPDMFYEGVMFGISSANSHKVEYSRLQPDRTSKALYDDLLEMKPTPTHVLRRLATCNNTEWNEKGYGVYFSYKDLQTQGMLSSDTLQPWKRVLEPILWKARKFKQVYITVWYPYQFGDPVTTEKITYPLRKYRHMNIIQSVLPTRTGLDGLKSTSAVWMMEKNNTRVEILPRLVRGPVVPQYEQFVSVDNF